MILNLDGSLAHLPGIHHFLQQQRAELQRGRSVLAIMAQNGYGDRLWELCYDDIYRTRLDVEAVDIGGFGSHADPLAILSDTLHLNLSLETSFEPLRALMTADLPQVTVLQGLNSADPAERLPWLSLMSEWAATATAITSTTGRRPPALWGMFAPAPDEVVPAEDAWLRVQQWWALPSDLDMRLLCRLHEGHDHSRLEPLTVWREAVLPALSGNDLALAEYLWDIVDQPLDAIIERLRAFAAQQQWTATVLEQWGVRNFLRQQGNGPRRFRLRPLHHERELWLRGILQQTPENGLQLSPAVLATLGERRQLEHLLWRGQASLLLPLIDELRLSICEALTRKYGPDWPVLWARPRSEEDLQKVRQNPMAVELGHLKHAIRRCPHPDAASQAGLVSHIWALRNKLAHYTPVHFSEYDQLMSLIG